MNHTSSTVRVVKYIILVNIAVFFVQLTNQNPWFLQSFALSSFGWEDGRYYQLFTYMWLHGSLTHLLFNMIGLWCFGRELVSVTGRLHFLLLYALSGLAGGALWILFNQNSLYPMVGASAAVLGLVTAFATLFPRVKLLVFPFPFPIQARWLAVGYTLLTLIFVLRGSFSQIAHLAHLGGMAIGYLYTRIFLLKKVPTFSRW